MSVRKRNEFLEDEESDAELDDGYDSDANEESRGAIGGRKNKRRRLGEDSDQETLDGLEDDSTGEAHGNILPEAEESGAEEQRQENKEDDFRERAHGKANGIQAKPSTPKEVTKAQKAARKSGVIYISRIPPFMKPATLRHFLAPHAPHGLGRLFLTPEDGTTHKSRVKNGGNKKKSFVDGWVEFTSKKDAKRAVEMLNGAIVGGKKGGWFHDDVWSMRYLRGFKWENLTEQISSENAERAARLREEIRKGREENRRFVEGVERGKMLGGMEKKARSKGKMREGGDAMEANGKGFKQKTAAIWRESKADDSAERDGAVARLSGMIFG